ncbi:phytanoyl-CoA dioxygenase family protein [Maribacter sp. 2210JD10-5]|uniref:phytanoyl-CoA dioxygenase family protein n=1 Tax=Maribacter sp. 2210JD10-5 TaxID=3386272 RepID=UPI0039BD569D
MRQINSIINGKVTQENILFYNEYGFLVAPNLLNKKSIDELNDDAVKIVTGKSGEIEGVLPVEVNDTIEDTLKRYAAIHFPHKVSDVMKKHASCDEIAEVLSKIVSPNVKCLQTMLFMKAPGKKGQSWHQDEYFIPTRDKSLIGAWIALEDADEENGCLWVIPKSHKEGYIRKRIPNENPNFADVDRADIKPYTEKDMIKVEVTEGSVIFFHGYLLHMSLANRSNSRFRRALVGHYSSAETMLPWDQDGRLDFTHDNRDIFMVAGKDPYAHKGTVDLSKPFVRPDVMDFNTEASRKRLQREG